MATTGSNVRLRRETVTWIRVRCLTFIRQSMCRLNARSLCARAESGFRRNEYTCARVSSRFTGVRGAREVRTPLNTRRGSRSSVTSVLRLRSHRLVYLGERAERSPARRSKREKEDATSLFGGGSGWPRPVGPLGWSRGRPRR